MTITDAARKVARKMDDRLATGKWIISRQSRPGSKFRFAQSGRRMHTNVTALLETVDPADLDETTFAELLEALNN